MQNILKFYRYSPWAVALVSLALAQILHLAGSGYLFFMGVMAALVMGWDKHLAQGDGVRVPEKVLYTWAFLGGAAGLVAGMYLFHHKIRHPVFRFVLPLLAAVQLYVVSFGIPQGLR